jgi:hypothetical protein
MSRSGRRVGASLIVVAIGMIAAPGGFAQAGQQCNRACLQGFVDKYLDALVAHDASRAPFAPNVKATENGQELGVHDGLWKTANGNSTYRLYFADAAQGQVGFIGVIKEHDLPAIIAVRLKVANRLITEAETIVARAQARGGFAKPETFVEPIPILETVLPPAERVSREEMIRIANSYFTGLDEEDSGKNVSFDKDCQRREDGTITANSPDPNASPMMKLGCKAQFDTGFSKLVTGVRERRFPVVDVERGLIYTVIFFDHAGNVESYTTPEGKVVPVGGTFRRPLTFMIGELFKIRSGRIRQIEAVLLEVPYGMPSGWGSEQAASAARAAPVAQAAPPVPTCNRDCLLGVVDKYVDALVKKDPKQAPFADNARFTENAQVLKLGDGLWNTASEGPQGYKLVVADPARGEAGFYMLMKENGNPIWLSGRLKVDAQKITELETVIIRKGSGFGNFDLTAPVPVWNEVLEPAQRRPRAEMVEIANKYLEAIEKNLADYAPFDEKCNRIENGTQTTNNTSLHFGGDGPDVGKLGCRENINSMMWRYITRISPRRFLVVDEERGIVIGVFMFQQDGSIPATNVPGFGEYKYSAQTLKPFTTVIPEMFKIRDGKILQIEATMASIPYGSKSRWEGR